MSRAFGRATFFQTGLSLILALHLMCPRVYADPRGAPCIEAHQELSGKEARKPKDKKKQPIALQLLRASLSSYGMLVVGLFFLQGYIQYIPTHRDRDGAGTDTLKPWRDEAGDFLGYVRDSEGPPRKVVILFHGNAGEALYAQWGEKLAPGKDTAFVLAEYPGYGAKAGSPSEASICASAERLYDKVKERWKNVPVRVVGYSLGTGVATHLAARREVERLALVAPFTSVEDVAAGKYPIVPVRQLIKDRFLSEKNLAHVKAPLYILHGTNDKTVPIALGRKLFESYTGGPKTFAEVPGAGHLDITESLLTAPQAEAFRKFVAE